MRLQALLAAAAIAAIAASAYAADEVGERDVARPGGVYTTVNTSDAAVCAALCTRDDICMAWTLTSAGVCELKAVAPNPVQMTGAVSGLSPRAPDFLRRIGVAPAAPQQLAAATPAEHHRRRSNEEAEQALLGGADGGDLRPTFGASN